MSTPYALLAVSDNDRDEAAAVAYVVQHGGWRVTSVDFNLISPDMADDLVSQATAVIVVWSASGAEMSAVGALAKAAAAIGKLVIVQLDHSALPLRAEAVIDASGWRDQPSPAGRDHLLRVLTVCAERAPDAPGFASKARRPRLRVPIVAGLSLGLVGIGLLAAAGTAFLNARNQQAAAELAATPSPTIAPAPRPASGASIIELEAWRSVTAAQGAAETLAALARYKDRFPNGAMLKQAERLEQMERRTVEQVQQLLTSRGFATTDPPGNIGRATTTAAAAFQASHDLPIDGRITADLLIALERVPPAAHVKAERSARP